MGSAVSLLDETLISLAASGCSGEEMELRTGIPAERAVAHVKELMRRRDVWTEVEQRQLLLFELMNLKDSLRDSATRLGDLDSARLLLKTLEVIGRRLDVQQTSLNADVLKLSEYQQSVLLRAMDAALTFAKKELLEKYPTVNASELDGLVAEGLVRAKDELSAE